MPSMRPGIPQRESRASASSRSPPARSSSDIAPSSSSASSASRRCVPSQREYLTSRPKSSRCGSSVICWLLRRGRRPHAKQPAKAEGRAVRAPADHGARSVRARWAHMLVEGTPRRLRSRSRSPQAHSPRSCPEGRARVAALFVELAIQMQSLEDELHRRGHRGGIAGRAELRHRALHPRDLQRLLHVLRARERR